MHLMDFFTDEGRNEIVVTSLLADIELLNEYLEDDDTDAEEARNMNADIAAMKSVLAYYLTEDDYKERGIDAL